MAKSILKKPKHLFGIFIKSVLMTDVRGRTWDEKMFWFLLEKDAGDCGELEPLVSSMLMAGLLTTWQARGYQHNTTPWALLQPHLCKPSSSDPHGNAKSSHNPPEQRVEAAPGLWSRDCVLSVLFVKYVAQNRVPTPDQSLHTHIWKISRSEKRFS